jgi:uncharacterized protein (TIGR00303 family)
MQKIIMEHHPFKDKKGDFVLAACVTRTCEIDGITQAGIPGNIPYTPTLDAEFITTGEVFSLPDIAETPKGVPTPALITRVAHDKACFSKLTIFDLGLDVMPQKVHLKAFDINVSGDISKGSALDAKLLFYKGCEAAKNYELEGDYLILGESTPSGTTTAYASAKALGFNTDGLFSSSFKAVPDDIKSKVVQASLSYVNKSMTAFEKLDHTSDNMLMFCAGFVYEASKHFKVMLAGGTQMAAVLLILDRVAEFKGDNIFLCTTKWVYEDENSDINGLLSQLSVPIKAYWTDFDFSLSKHPALQLYDQGEAKEGVGAGAALSYLYAHGVGQKEITQSVEALLR